MINNFVLMRAYNSEKFIADTLDNTFSLNIPHLKVILVNDGSTDKTQQVLSSFQKKYPSQVYVRCQKNQGAAGALKTVFKTASQLVNDTDNVFVLDSDDTFSTEILTACEKLNEADICYLPYQMIGSSKYHSRSPQVHNNFAAFLSNKVVSIEVFSDIFKSIFANRVGIGYPLKAIKGHVLKKYVHNVLPHFPKETNVAEDIPSLLFPLFENMRITGVSDPVYNYMRRENSITGRVDRRNFISNLKFLCLISQLVNKDSDLFTISAPLVVKAFIEERMKPYLQQKIKTDQARIEGYSYNLSQFDQDWKHAFLTKPVCRFNLHKMWRQRTSGQNFRVEYSYS